MWGLSVSVKSIHIVSRLAEHGMTSGIKRTHKAGTAYGIVIAPPGNDRMFLEDPGCNGIFTSRDINYDIVAKSRLFHFGYPTLMKSLFVNNGAELRDLFVIQLAGDMGGYLPTARAVAGGGYGSLIINGYVGPEGGQTLVDASVSAIEELWNE